MAKRLALKARLKKLEQQQIGQPLRRKVIFAVMECDREIVAYSTINGVTVLRLAGGEKLEMFQARAFALTGTQFLSTRYAAHSPAERDSEAEPGFAPSAA